MRKLKLFIIPFFISAFIFCGCKKNMVDEKYTPVINPVTPDFTTKVNAAVNGFITDENGEAVEGANITGGTITATTDQFGYFKISTAAFAKSAGFIQVSKAGYFTGYRTFLPVEGKETFIRLQLIPKTNTGTVDAGAGGTVSTADGATVTLPANAVVVASNNTSYTGTVNIAAHWLNPSEEEKTNLTMPGNLTGIDTAGHLNVLQTFGMLAVELTGNSGELLQIAPGKKASLHFPIPSSLQGSAPASILLWYFDEAKGVWKEEGSALKNGSNYEGDVSHFTWWNCDVPSPLVHFKAQLVDNNLQPLVNIPVMGSINGLGFQDIVYTDAAGFINELVPANSTLTLSVPACNQNIVFNNSIVIANSDIDLGSVIVNLGQQEATISGTVNKCDGSPVTNGHVIIYGGVGSNSVINISNGAFSAAGPVCLGATVFMIAFDDDAAQKSIVHFRTWSAGNNDAGVFSACNPPAATEFISIQSNSDTTFTLGQHSFGGNFYFLNDSTVINAIDLLNGGQLSFQFSFTGTDTTGIYPLSNNKFNLANLEWQFVSPTSVTVSSYGLVGQFITGSFEGSAMPVGGGAAQNFNINFNVQRDQ